MNGKYLLDTNIVIALFAGDSALTGKIAKAEDIFVPAVVIGELFYGADKSGRPEKNSGRIDIFVSDNVIRILPDGMVKLRTGYEKKDARFLKMTSGLVGETVNEPSSNEIFKQL